MSRSIEARIISFTNGAGTAETLDLSKIPTSPEEMKPDFIKSVLDLTVDKGGKKYSVRLGEAPHSFIVSPPLQPAAQAALEEYFGIGSRGSEVEAVALPV